MVKKRAYVFTVINILFQIVWLTFGKYSMDELGVLRYIFFVFRAEYMLGSSPVSGYVLYLIWGPLIARQRKIRMADILLSIINIEHIVYYLLLMSNA